MKIALDIDGCMAEFVRPFLNYYNNQHLTELKYEDVTDYSMDMLGEDFKKNFRKDYDRFIASGYFLDLCVVDGSQEIVTQMKRDGHIIDVVTGRSDSYKGVNDTKRWLNTHMIPYDKLCFRDAKDKPQYLEDAGVDVVVEDYYDTAVECGKRNINALLYHRPWNKNKPSAKGVIAVRSWHEVYDIVNMMGLIE